MRASNYNFEIELDEGALLVNFLSRAVLELDRESLAAFRDLSVNPSDASGEFSEFVNVLREGRFLVDDNFDEFRYLQDRVNRERRNPDELAIVIAPTMGCNFNCHYCFEHRTEGEMSAEAEHLVLDYVARHLPGRSKLAVQWFGGEPLKALGQIERLSKGLMGLASQLGAGYAAAIVTNGHMLTEETSSLLQTCGVHSAQITIDGDKDLHDRTRRAQHGSSFDTLLSNVKLAAKFLEITLRLHVAPFNIQSVKALLRELARQGIGACTKEIYFAPLFDYKPTSVSAQFKADGKRFFSARDFAVVETELFAEVIRLGLPVPDPLDASFSVCTAVRENAIVVGPSGNFYKCYFELDKPDHAVGSLQNGVVPSDHLSRWLDHEIARDEECRTCKFLPVCFGGCSHKWHEGASKDVICTRLKFNAPKLLPMLYSGFE